MASAVRTSGEPRRWAFVGILMLTVGGSCLAVLPHAIAWARSGDPTYIPDGDGLLYLAWSRGVVLSGEGRIADAIHRSSGPMMHPWLLFVPPAQLARSLGLGMTGLGEVWRVVAGALMALGLFAAVRPSTKRSGLAIGLAAFLLCDPGMMFGQLLRREFEILASLARGGHSFLTGVPRLMPHLRVVTPGLALPVLLFHFGATLRARRGGGAFWRALAVGSFGLLFHVYFYYWTMVGLGLALAFLLDRDGRRLYLLVLVGGLAIGAPAVWAGSVVKRSTSIDWLWRTNKFIAIGRFDELLWPRGLIATWLAVGYWVFRRRPELIYWWCCVGAGLICLNHQVVSGLQIENEHWSGAYGVTFSLLLAGLAAPWLDRVLNSGRTGRWALGIVLAVQVAVGFGLRAIETTRSDETRLMQTLYDHWRADPALREIPAGSVVAGEPQALFLAAGLSEIFPLSCRLVEFSAKADDAELDERLVLNAFLSGAGRDEFRRSVEGPPGTLSWEAAASRSPELAAAQRQRRLALIDAVWGDPRPLIDRFEVSWVVLPPARRTDHLAGLAQLVKSGPGDRLWRIRPTSKRAG